MKRRAYKIPKAQVQEEFDEFGSRLNVVHYVPGRVKRETWVSGLNIHSALAEIVKCQNMGHQAIVFLDEDLEPLPEGVNSQYTWLIDRYLKAGRSFKMSYNFGKIIG
jgi:hypothetical protein